MSTETTAPPTPRHLDEKPLRDLIGLWRERAGSVPHAREAEAYGEALGDCADELERFVASVVGGQHKHAFPCNPPGGTMQAPGPCRICGITWDRAQAEKQLREAQEAMAAVDGGTA